MGMRPAEIAAKFERIVAFAQVDQFIDTPVKYYSSGMQVRLGFSVAVHVDPDILLVDEVLAVGDAAFQAKCLNKIAELKSERGPSCSCRITCQTSSSHCDRVLWIDHGTLRRRVIREHRRGVFELGASARRGEQPSESRRPRQSVSPRSGHREELAW
jgi:ABC-type polysaccharide/polyol phosphate transport system ATPase subunit